MDRLQKRIALALCGVLAVVVALVLVLSGGGSASEEGGIVSGDSSIAARAAALGVSEEGQLEAEQEASERAQRILDLSFVMHKDVTTSPFYNPRSQIDAATKDEELTELCDSMTEEAREELEKLSMDIGYDDLEHTCESGWALEIRRERQGNVGRIRAGEIEKLPSYKGRVTEADYRGDTVVVTIQFGDPRTKPAGHLTLVDDDGEWKMGTREQTQGEPLTPTPELREEDFGAKPRSTGDGKSGD